VDDVSFCKECEPGTFNPNEGSLSPSDCAECPVGTYSPEFGTAECPVCETGTETGQEQCSFIVDTFQGLRDAFGNGAASAAKGGETYIAKAGLVYTCSLSAGECADNGLAMLHTVGWFGHFECEADLECTLDGQRSIQSTRAMGIMGSGGEMLHVQGFKMINAEMNIVSSSSSILPAPPPTNPLARERPCSSRAVLWSRSRCASSRTTRPSARAVEMEYVKGGRHVSSAQDPTLTPFPRAARFSFKPAVSLLSTAAHSPTTTP
jgi:hypothetical protein